MSVPLVQSTIAVERAVLKQWSAGRREQNFGPTWYSAPKVKKQTKKKKKKHAVNRHVQKL